MHPTKVVSWIGNGVGTHLATESAAAGDGGRFGTRELRSSEGRLSDGKTLRGVGSRADQASEDVTDTVRREEVVIDQEGDVDIKGDDGHPPRPKRP